MFLDSFRQDVRVGLRLLLKEKSFCFLAVLVLDLGIGGATPQFTVVNAIGLRGLAFPHPEQLMTVGLIDPEAGDQKIVGQGGRINGKAATVIGVMPPNFKFPVSEELWVPYYNEFPLRPRGAPIFGAGNSAPAIMGRLKPDVTLDQVNAEFVGLARRLAGENPKTNQNLTSANIQPLANSMVGPQFRQT